MLVSKKAFTFMYLADSFIQNDLSMRKNAIIELSSKTRQRLPVLGLKLVTLIAPHSSFQQDQFNSIRLGLLTIDILTK